MTDHSQIHDLLTKQREYFLAGNTQSLKERLHNLEKLKDLLIKNENRIAEAVYNDFGKSFYEVRSNELGIVYDEISRIKRKLKRWSKGEKKLTGLLNLPGKSRVYRVPLGNVLVISPWNYPVQLALMPIVSALAAGNTVLLKPSEITEHTSTLLAELLGNEFPEELLAVRNGGVEVTSEILKHRFDKIFFTGSTRVGRIIMKAAAEHLTPVTLELGGKNPAIVLPDCNIRMTARRLVWGKFHNGGQACVAPDHIYVHEDIREKLVDELKQAVNRMFRGDPAASGMLPKIINKQGFQRLSGYIDRDKVVAGGELKEEERYIEPTILTDITKDDPVMQDEIFGPLMPLLTFHNLDSLLDQLKKEESPLAFYIYTSNIRLATRIQREFRSGGGMINDNVMHFINGTTPFGGVGASGMGQYHGRAGFECFSHQKTVITKPTWFELWLKYAPYTSGKLKLVRFFLK